MTRKKNLPLPKKYLYAIIYKNGDRYMTFDTLAAARLFMSCGDRIFQYERQYLAQEKKS